VKLGILDIMKFIYPSTCL